MIVKYDLVSRPEISGTAPLFFQGVPGLFLDSQHGMIAGKAQRIAFLCPDGEKRLDPRGEKARRRGFKGLSVDDQGGALAYQIHDPARPLCSKDKSVARHARIGRLVLPDVRGGVEAVHLFDEDDARITLGPGLLHDEIKDLARMQLHHLPRFRIGVGFAGTGVDQGIVGVRIRPRRLVHEAVGDGHGEVEVADLALLLLAADKFQYVGVVVDERTHVGTAANATLFYSFGGGIEDLQKGDGAAGCATGGAHAVAGGPQPVKGKTGPAAGLLHQGHMFERGEDPLHAVLHGQDETGAELLQIASGIHQGGGIGQEIGAGHGLEKLFLDLFYFSLILAVFPLYRSHVRGHPPEQILGGLQRFALQVFF